MRFADVLGLSLTALWQRKLRTTLTLLGVVFGTLVLVVAASLGLGVQETILREYARHSELRSIDARPIYGSEEAPPEEELRVEGQVSAERRQRLRAALAERWQRFHGQGPKARLTPERVEALRQIDHVESVRPIVRLFGRAVLEHHTQDVTITAGDFTGDRLRGRLVAGRLPGPDEDDAAALTEPLLYFLGVHSDADVERALGQKVRVEYRLGGRSPNLLLVLLHADATSVGPDEEKVLDKALAQLPDALAQTDLSDAEKATLKKLLARRPKQPIPPGSEMTISEEFTLTGVLRAPTADERMRDWRLAEAGVFLTQRAAERLFLRTPQYREQGFEGAIVMADDLASVKPVSEAVRDEGLQGFSMLERAERERFIYLMVFGGMTIIAVIALLVAGLGIMNTMLMGVLERTREIGILKAVGARDGHIQLMFLVEGALVGLLGGLLGLLVGWLISFPADAWVRSMVSRQLTVKLEESLFGFPWWLVAGAPLFAMLVTTLAAVLPARRAARINPVEALRHE